jgi:hypothetical protein
MSYQILSIQWKESRRLVLPGPYCYIWTRWWTSIKFQMDFMLLHTIPTSQYTASRNNMADTLVACNRRHLIWSQGAKRGSETRPIRLHLQTAETMGNSEAESKWLRLSLSEWPKRVGVSLSTPEDGNRFSFRNNVFSSYIEFRTMDNIHKPSDS